MNAIRKYTRIAKWRRRQCGYRKLKEAMIDILGLKIKQTREELDKRYELDVAILVVTNLIYYIAYRYNPYKAKEDCKKYSIINAWLEFYGLNIYQLDNNDIDVL